MARSKKRLEELLNRLESGEDVAARDLKNALTVQEFEYYENHWQWIQDLKSGIGIEICSEYEKIIHDADFTYNKAESGRFNKTVSKRLHEVAQSQYEHGIEILKEAIGQNPNIAVAYDRFPDSFSEDIGLCPEGVPRAINSKSFHNQSTLTKTTKREIKIAIVRSSLTDFDSSEEHKEIRKEGVEGMVKTVQSAKEGQGSKLKQMLANLKK
jgi:hypothetical protein